MDSGAVTGVDVVAAAVSSTPLDEVVRIVRDRYGLVAAARRLSSERDENFALSTDDGRAYLLKLSNAAEDRQVTDFQTQALVHVARADPGLPVPHLVPATDGDLTPVLPAGAGGGRAMRLLTYLPGEPMHGAPRSALQCRRLGTMLGRLDLALEGYTHPGESHVLRWDLMHAATLRPLLPLIEDGARRALATGFLDQFEYDALPRLSTMRAQVIHNDFQPSNILVDAGDPTEVTGIIDFGDMVRAPLVNDLAVACAYHVWTAPEPFDYVREAVGAYHAVLPLQSGEIDLLYDLMATRMVLTAVITNWRVTLHPDNRAYILRNAPAAWGGLERLAALGRDTANAMLRRVCAAS